MINSHTKCTGCVETSCCSRLFGYLVYLRGRLVLKKLVFICQMMLIVNVWMYFSKHCWVLQFLVHWRCGKYSILVYLYISVYDCKYMTQAKLAFEHRY